MILLKKISLIFALIFFTKIYSQKNDTIFIKNDIHQKIYIVKNKSSDYYKDLNYFQDFAAIGKKEKTNQFELSNKWIRIYKYKGQYILYVPCDLMNDTKIVIDDEKIQLKASEIVDYKIKCIKKKGENIIIKYKDPFLKKNILLKISPINKEKGIYRFKVNKEFEYLMLEADKYQNFDILVNDCIDNKLQEFKFNQ